VERGSMSATETGSTTLVAAATWIVECAQCVIGSCLRKAVDT
jgi:hypothetical protein